MVTIKGGTPHDVIDRILGDEIDQLLKEPGEDDEQQKNEPDPYSLENPLKFNECKSIEATKERSKEYREAKSSYIKSFISEMEVLKNINGELNLTGIFTAKNNYIKVTLPGTNNNYFIKKETLINWASRYMNSSFFRYYKNGYCLVVMIEIPTDVLLNNCRALK